MKISNILSYVQMINWKYLRAKTTKILNKKKKLYIDVDSNFWAEPQPRSGYDVFLTKDKLNSNIYEKKFTIILYWMQTVSSIFQVPGFLALLWLLLPLPDPPPLPPSDGLLSSERYFLHWKRLLSRKEMKNVQSYLGNSGIVMYWRPFSDVQKKNGQPKKREMEGEKNPWDIKW